MEFSVTQESFSGPLGLLLDLLDRKELEIADVALATITEEYLNYLEKTEVPTEEMADFLLIASRLIYLKSRELMPYLRMDEEEEAVANLEDQLRLYRMFVDAAEKIEKGFMDESMMFRRPFVKIKPKVESSFSAPGSVTAGNLSEAFGWILKKLQPFFALQEASIEKIKSIEERIDELTSVITSRASIGFREVLKGAKSKPEVVVSFLALLELVRRQVVRASQKRVDHDIIIERV